MTLKLPRLQPIQPNWSSFQIWWQQFAEAVEAQEATQDATILELQATEATLAAAQASLATTQTGLAATVAALAAAQANITALQAMRNACMVRKSVDEVGADYTGSVSMTWDQEVYDDGGWHDNVTNNHLLTVPAGVSRVRVGATVSIINATGGIEWMLGIRKNGLSGYDGRAANSGIVLATLPTRFGVQSRPIPVVAGDTFELRFQVTTDAAIDVVSTQTNFGIEAA